MKLRQFVHKQYWAFRQQLIYPLAYIWRRILVNTTVIVITGSVGKTTTKEMLVAILSTHSATVHTKGNTNGPKGAAGVILRASRKTRFAIIEYGITQPGRMAFMSRILKPDIVVALAVARQHTKSFRTLEHTANEKVLIFNHMAPNGTAIINVDDPLVCKMEDRISNKIIRFGTDAHCDIQHYQAESVWPKRASVMIGVGDQKQYIQTQLIGTHWTSSVAAAISAAHVCGISLEDSANAIALVPPFIARMQPVHLPKGATLIRDEYNGTQFTFEKIISVLKQAHARRKVLIISDISDRKGNARTRQRDIGRIAAEHCDLAIFCSEHGHHAQKVAIQAGMNHRRCYHLTGLRAVAELMQACLLEGDLVFLKGWVSDHLSRLVFAQFGNFACWKESCKKTIECALCVELEPEFNLQKMTAPQKRQTVIS